MSFTPPATHGVTVGADAPTRVAVPAVALAEVQVLDGDPCWVGTISELQTGFGLKVEVGGTYTEPLRCDTALFVVSEGSSTVTWKGAR